MDRPPLHFDLIILYPVGCESPSPPEETAPARPGPPARRRKCRKGFNRHKNKVSEYCPDLDLYRCLGCNQLFDTAQRVSKHHRRIHQQKNLNKRVYVECDLCGKVLSSKQILALHRTSRNCYATASTH